MTTDSDRPVMEVMDPTTYEVTCEVTVRIVVNREDAITRCVENVDGWQDMFGQLDSPEEVLNHWSFNAIANGYEDASRLDGWADLDPGDVTMTVVREWIDPMDHHIR